MRSDIAEGAGIRAAGHMVGDWKLDLMAKKIFEAIWTDRKEDAKLAYKLLRECYQADASRNKATIAAVQGKISRATG